MSTFTYHFDELEIIDGLAIYAVGEADISYRICPAEPDVGYMEPYAGDVEIESIKIYESKGKSAKVIDYKNWLYPLIEEALMKDESIHQACMEDADQ